MLTYRQFLTESKSKVFSTPEEAYNYLHRMVKRASPQNVISAENMILTSADWAARYACNIKGMTPELEKVIKQSPIDSWLIAAQMPGIAKFVEDEDGFRHPSHDWLTDEDVLRWLETKGTTDQVLWVMNKMGVMLKSQEYICQHRPDLIGKIEHLDPELAKKYSHEQELGKVDL
jgi:hypothetical protein